MKTVKRYNIADYLNTDKTGSKEEFALMGVGFNTLDENPNAQTDTKTYISEKASSSVIKSYQPQFSFDSDLIKEESAIMALYNVGRNQLCGTDAEFDYVRVELFQPVEESENTYKARKFRVSAEISSYSGAGGETVTVSGNLNAVGNFIDGTFNTKTRTFTETTP